MKLRAVLMMLMLFMVVILSIRINGAQSNVDGELVPYVPFPEQVDLEFWMKDQIAYINVTLTLSTPCYNVSWGEVTKDGYNLWVDSEIWRWTGPCILVIDTRSHTYNLGRLEEGNYTFTFKAWGTDVKSISFKIGVSSSTPDLCIEAILLPYVSYVPCIYPPPEPYIVYSIKVNVTNQGTADAGSFNVSFSAYWEEEEEPEELQKKTIASLEQGATKTVYFEFVPQKYGNYTLIIMADCDNNIAESDETNNIKTTWVIGSITGDITGDTLGSPPDGDVDKFDLAIFAENYRRKFAKPPYHPADIDYNGVVDYFDLGYFAENYRKSWK